MYQNENGRSLYQTETPPNINRMYNVKVYPNVQELGPIYPYTITTTRDCYNHFDDSKHKQSVNIVKTLINKKLITISDSKELIQLIEDIVKDL